MISDFNKKPDDFDYKTSLSALARRHPPHQLGFILRDYQHPRRAQLAATLAPLCQRLHITFFLAGENKASPHKPYMRQHNPAPQRNRAQNKQNCTSAHNAAAIYRAARWQMGAVLISPVFATPSHAGALPLGVMRFTQLARLAHTLSLRAYALGGMNATTWQALAPAHTFCAGFAAIRHFQKDL